jgi:isopentenyl-diphosphate delta-isomerase
VNGELFENRKQDHIRISLREESQSYASTDWERVVLQPEALPDLDLSEVSIGVQSLGRSWCSPFFVSSMTAGHAGSLNINSILAEACALRGWMLGVGSQRRELEDLNAAQEWRHLRQRHPSVLLASNIGISQLIHTPTDMIQRLVENTGAIALFVHTNPLQECLQPEGTPQFRGGLRALEKIVKVLSVPVIVKEVGSGMSIKTVARLSDTGVAAVDVSGRGGTHWGRVEGMRAEAKSPQALAAEVFQDWGLSTPRVLKNLAEAEGSKNGIEIWASGGIRNGLQAAKCLAMGAKRVGLAKPFLEQASTAGY